MMVFESDLAPVVGQQVTLTSANPARGGDARRRCSRRGRRRTSPPSCLAAWSRSATSSPRWWRAASSAASSSTPPRCSSSPTTAAPASRTRRCATRRWSTATPSPSPAPRPAPATAWRSTATRTSCSNGVETNTGVYLDPQHTGSNPALADTDGDGFDDGVEVAGGLQPERPALEPELLLPAGARRSGPSAWAPWRA